MDVDSARLSRIRESPHVFEQAIAGEHDPRLPAERLEELELLRAKRDDTFADVYLMACGIDAYVPNHERSSSPGHARRPPQDRPDARDELLGVERLGHVVVHSGLERLDLLDVLRPRREGENRRVRVPTDLAEQ